MHARMMANIFAVVEATGQEGCRINDFSRELAAIVNELMEDDTLTPGVIFSLLSTIRTTDKISNCIAGWHLGMAVASLSDSQVLLRYLYLLFRLIHGNGDGLSEGINIEEAKALLDSPNSQGASVWSLVAKHQSAATLFFILYERIRGDNVLGAVYPYKEIYTYCLSQRSCEALAPRNHDLLKHILTLPEHILRKHLYDIQCYYRADHPLKARYNPSADLAARICAWHFYDLPEVCAVLNHLDSTHLSTAAASSSMASFFASNNATETSLLLPKGGGAKQIRRYS